MKLRTLVTPVFAAVVASVAAFVLLVIFAAGEQDDLSLASEKAVLTQEVKGFSRELVVLATDNAWWDTAAQKIMFNEDMDWIENSIGATVEDLAEIDGTLIVRPDLTIVYSFHQNDQTSPRITPDMLLSSTLGNAISGLTINNDPDNAVTSGLVVLENHLVAYGASLVRANDEILYEAHPSVNRPTLVFYSVLTDFDFHTVGTDNAIQKLRFRLNQPETNSRMALLDERGATIGWLKWDSKSPGTQMALDLVLPSAVLLILVVFAMIRFVQRANKLVDGLEEANKSKNSFLASMSHEVRTPLNSILGFSELMSLELFGKIEGQKNKEYLQLIRDSGEHLLSIINDILDISKLEAGKFEVYAEEVKPDRIIGECIRMIEPSAQDKSITVTHHCETASLYSDERIMRQILINILSNAIKFTSRDGAVHVLGERKRGHYQILVTDNGIGMTPKEVETALSTFGQVQNKYSNSQSGTGLGLPLVKRFIKLLDGSMNISSNPGKGTTVTLIFPYRTTAKKL